MDDNTSIPDAHAAKKKSLKELKNTKSDEQLKSIKKK
jgi:hypothetical protein